MLIVSVPYPYHLTFICPLFSVALQSEEDDVFLFFTKLNFFILFKLDHDGFFWVFLAIFFLKLDPAVNIPVSTVNRFRFMCSRCYEPGVTRKN